MSNPQDKPASYWLAEAKKLFDPDTELFGKFGTGGACADFLCSTAVRAYLVASRKADHAWRLKVKAEAQHQPT